MECSWASIAVPTGYLHFHLKAIGVYKSMRLRKAEPGCPALRAISESVQEAAGRTSLQIKHFKTCNAVFVLPHKKKIKIAEEPRRLI